MENQKLIAFWKYDRCPYMLCGEVERFNDNGTVLVKGYGGMSFKPIAIIPGIAGDEMVGKFENIQAEYEINNKALNKTYAKKARDLIGLKGE